MAPGAAGPRILVTAFEPFAPPGKPKRPENASETVLRAFGARKGEGYDLLMLPVDARCEVLLARALSRDPAGVVSMGETGQFGGWDTNVEEFARDVPVRPGGFPGASEGGFRSSLFAAELPLLPGMDRADRIGSWWCNRAYFRVLEWCGLFHRPAAFLHLRVEGNRARQIRHLEYTVSHMESGLRGPPPGRRVTRRATALR